MSARLIFCLGLVGLLLAELSVATESGARRQTRQSRANPRQMTVQADSQAGAAMAAAASMSAEPADGAPSPVAAKSAPPAADQARPDGGYVRPSTPPRRRQPAKKRPVFREPIEEEPADEECAEEYARDDYTSFVRLATDPMRQISRMMSDMFDRMPAFEPEEFEARGAGARSAAFSAGDGYSKALSAVTDNGRTRGIVSETRNGRTQTRRFGGDGDDDE